MAAVEIADPQRVRFRLKEPWPDFMTYYGSLTTGAGWIVPRKYLEKVGDEGFKKAPVGAGPYRFVSFNPGVELTLEANEQYWRKVPSVKRLVFKVDLRRGHAAGHAEARRGRRRLSPPGRAGRRRQAYARTHAQADAHRLDALARVRRSVGSEIAVGGSARAPGRQPSRSTARRSTRRSRSASPGSRGASSPRASTSSGSRPRTRTMPLGRSVCSPRPAIPNGFDAGDLWCDCRDHQHGRGVRGYLQAAGIRAKVRPLERAAFFKGYQEKKLKNLVYRS